VVAREQPRVSVLRDHHVRRRERRHLLHAHADAPAVQADDRHDPSHDAPDELDPGAFAAREEADLTAIGDEETGRLERRTSTRSFAFSSMRHSEPSGASIVAPPGAVGQLDEGRRDQPS
jgi:hypothetical protein